MEQVYVCMYICMYVYHNDVVYDGSWFKPCVMKIILSLSLHIIMRAYIENVGELLDTMEQVYVCMYVCISSCMHALKMWGSRLGAGMCVYLDMYVCVCMYICNILDGEEELPWSKYMCVCMYAYHHACIH